MKATWNDTVIAESDDTVVVEGNHYFPANSVREGALANSATRTTCSWKGVAGYHHVVAGGQVNEDAAWFYADPLPAAQSIAGRIAFWKDVTVTE